MKLQHYHQKRHFKHTPEPKGKVAKKSSHLFVVQMHAARNLHYDFRLEVDGVLKSWAVPKGPSLDPSVKRLAVHVEDHPIEYGDFEGVIPKGHYGAGAVIVWDKGKWSEVESDKTKNEGMTILLEGEKLKGKWKLVQIKSDPKNWLLMKVRDEKARSQAAYNILEEKPLSVKSGKSINEISGIQKLPTAIQPQLATLVSAPPKGKKWLHEMKFDGYRLLAVIEEDVKLITRGQQDWTHKFKKLALALKKLKLAGTILDGEVVAIDQRGHPNFQLLQNSLSTKIPMQIIYYVFDLIFYQGQDVSKLHLIERKAILRKILPKKSALIHYSDHIQGQGEKVFKTACELGFEGIISKQIDSHYIQRRTKNWQKSKCVQSDEFIIVGFTKPKGGRGYLGALLLGQFSKDNQLHYCGRVGTGFSDASLKEIYTLLSKIKIKESPFVEKVPMQDFGSWVEPKIVVEVEFNERTQEGILRHPSFKGIRADKIERKTDYQLTHPERILYPEQNISKLQIAQFYDNIQDWILPYIVDRPLSVLRCPQGINVACFFQKHLNKHKPVDVYSKDDYLYIQNLKGLIQLVQMNVLEIHPWGSRLDKIEKPDMMIFDLDPGEDILWKTVIKTAVILKAELEQYDLQSFVKTTGGKGLHVIVPIQRRYEWQKIFDFAKVFVQYLTAKYPADYIDVMDKSKRKGKIFIDYLRNNRGSTTIAPYSIRARENAPVATPLDWLELNPNMKPTDFSIANLEKRLKQLTTDPWKDFFSLKQKLPRPR